MLLLMFLMLAILLATLPGRVERGWDEARYSSGHTHLSGSGVFNFYDCINAAPAQTRSGRV